MASPEGVRAQSKYHSKSTELVTPYRVLLEGHLDNSGLHILALLGLLAGFPLLARLLAPRLLTPLLLLGAETSPARNMQDYVTYRTRTHHE